MDKQKRLLLGLLILMLSAYIFNCGPDNLIGEQVNNIPPTIKFTNLPFNDSVYSSNATINWYGEDEDGQVIGYYYIVVLEDDITGEIDDYISNELNALDINEWVMTEETEVPIQMFASPNEEDTLHQYIFVKCQDDDDEFSTATLYYSLFRVNRLPETYIEELPGNNPDTTVSPIWSLADTNSLWQGLTIAWSGEDTLDFPDETPEFEYEWKLYGPYDTSFYDSEAMEVNLTIDDVLEEDIIALSCSDNEDAYFVQPPFGETCENTWVWNTEITLTNAATGCYVFSVRARDDALVPDTSVAWGTFVVIQPMWVHFPELTTDILLVQSTQYWPTDTQPQGWPRQNVDIDDSSYFFPDVVNGFYTEMVDNAGEYSFEVFGDPAIGTNSSSAPTDFPSVYELANYRMIIIDDIDYHGIEYGSGSDAIVQYLMDYMSVGGRVWIIGRAALSGSGVSAIGQLQFDAASLAVDFFDLSSAVYAEANFSPPFGDINYGEFVGVSPIHGSYGIMEVDTTKTLLMTQIGLNRVETLVRSSAFSSTLFTYNAANPDTMPALFENMPCAVRYFPEHEVFRSAYFSFPLYFMDNSEGQVQTVFTDMLGWFFEED
ncbi:MAG: hypothetical protein GY839_11980 [candidate division Zixibacteria bacterium]|nr:hypothetical protein [candidate division Zixibacteria bacterium]